MARPIIRRFNPNTFTPHEAYTRATQTPREVRQLGEAVIGWSLGNIARDATSPLGDLPESFGFRPTRRPSADKRNPVVIALNDHTRLFVTPKLLWCSSEDGSTILLASEFEPRRATPDVSISRHAEIAHAAKRCAQPVDWVLAWNHLAAALRQLAEYEAWVQRRGLGLRPEEARPKAARKTEVATADLPAALSALSDWARDGEQAMLSWIIADAKARGVDAELPERYRRRPIDRILGLLSR